MARGLTARQRQVLRFIQRYSQEHGYAPTVREIADHLGVRSTNAVSEHLRALERKGYLARDDRRCRALRVLRTADGRRVEAAERPARRSGGRVRRSSAAGTTATASREAAIPLLGQVAAGPFSEAVEQHGERLLLAPEFFGAPERLVALRVRGESMIECGIHDGDYLVVERGRAPRRGDVVVVLLDGEATCKRFFPAKGHVRLEPANAALAPIYVPRSEWERLQVLGVVVGVVRRLEAAGAAVGTSRIEP